MVEVLLLGAAQDAGLPQAGCYCPNCTTARADPQAQAFAACLAILDHAEKAFWLIDATPHFPEQLHLVQHAYPSYTFRGLLLTHAHIGHYLGLAHLGREAMNTRELPVYATPSVCTFLKQNGPWSQLVTAHNIRLCAIQSNQSFWLTSHIPIRPIAVPHRAEYSDTVAYVISGPTRSVFYCPDIDRWEQWSHDLAQFLPPYAVAFLDGTFFSSDEIPNRNLAEIPHPLVTQTAERVANSPCEVVFIHLNHSNPLWHPGPERDWLEARHLKIGVQGMKWEV